MFLFLLRFIRKSMGKAQTSSILGNHLSLHCDSCQFRPEAAKANPTPISGTDGKIGIVYGVLADLLVVNSEQKSAKYQITNSKYDRLVMYLSL
jgi:hypothetical protein